jgi:hypothetical protein
MPSTSPTTYLPWLRAGGHHCCRTAAVALYLSRCAVIYPSGRRLHITCQCSMQQGVSKHPAAFCNISLTGQRHALSTWMILQEQGRQQPSPAAAFLRATAFCRSISA